jgi:gluconate 2-dehydrogenase gamma chain
MLRRDVLRTMALAAAACALPRELLAADLWAQVRRTHTRSLSPQHRALIGAIADIILPRTDTPSATDVGVTDFVDVIAESYYDAAERTAFVDGLDAIEALAQRSGGRAFVALALDAQTRLVEQLDRATTRTTPAERSYGRLKGLVIHGWYTSERVQRDVLQTQIMPGRFDGAAPHVVPARRGAPDGR